METMINTVNNHSVQMVNPLISVCIPTYNRGNILAQCLQSIVTQDGFDDRTEIIIVDNHSTDNTPDIATEYADRYHNILYIRNENNIGVEKNIIRVLTFGKGKLLKLLNDYSLLAPQALSALIDIAADPENEEAVIYFHNREYRKDKVICNDLNCFFKITTYWPTWIGAFAIWKEDFQQFTNLSQFEGLLFPHLLILLENYQQKQKIAVFFGKLLNEVSGIQYIQKGGFDFYKIYVQNFIGNIIQPLYRNKKINFRTLYILKSSFLKKYLNKWTLIILFERTHDFTDRNKNFSLVFTYFKYYPQFYFLFIQFLFYPLIKIARKMKSKLRYRLSPITGN